MRKVSKKCHFEVSFDAAVLMMSFPICEGTVYGSPVVIVKATMAECLHNLHVKYLLHIEPDAYAFAGLEYVCMRCVFDPFLFMYLLGPYEKSELVFLLATDTKISFIRGK